MYSNMNKFKKLDKIMPKHIIDNKIVEYFYSVDVNSDDDAIIRVYYHELQIENNFSVDADVQIDIKPDQVKIKKKSQRKRSLQKNRKRNMLKKRVIMHSA